MSTRSAIIEKHNDGYRGIYCHFDGYVCKNTEGSVGLTLHNHYQDASKVEDLIDLGSISSLGVEVFPDPTKDHSYDDKQEGVTVAYHRDCGEDLDICEGKTVEEVADQIDHNGYVYVFDGSWTVNGRSLAQALFGCPFEHTFS
jgi:hypothetical protein